MATWDDVGLIAATLPKTTECTGSGGVLAWRVRDKSFAWERPLRMSDIEALGDTGPRRAETGLSGHASLNRAADTAISPTVRG